MLYLGAIGKLKKIKKLILKKCTSIQLMSFNNINVETRNNRKLQKYLKKFHI